MRWICAVCGVADETTHGALGIYADKAREDGFEPWRTVHGECFDEAGMTYGIDFGDIASRGWPFWMGHVGDKAWAKHTDYAEAILHVASLLGLDVLA